jgi:hypothetical protein
MKFLRSVKIILFLAMLTGFCSCENYYTDEFFRNSDEKLCDRLWERSYITTDDELCTHRLEFRRTTPFPTGAETFEYRQQIDGIWSDNLRTTKSSTFYWKWADEELEGIMIDHPSGTLFFDNVWVRTHYLSGNLNGEEVTFFMAKILR